MITPVIIILDEPGRKILGQFKCNSLPRIGELVNLPNSPSLDDDPEFTWKVKKVIHIFNEGEIPPYVMIEVERISYIV
jgi:hypothetical protein